MLLSGIYTSQNLQRKVLHQQNRLRENEWIYGGPKWWTMARLCDQLGLSG